MSYPEGNPLQQMQIPVRWGDQDALGHVNNIVYFQYFESVRLQWYETVLHEPLATGNTGMVIVDNHARYLKPVLYPALLTLYMAGHSPGRSSFQSTYALCIDDEVFTTGSSKVVWVDHRKGKSVPLPDPVRQLLT